MSVPDRPISAVLQDIVRNIQDIVRSEMRLAKTEIQEELAKTRSAGALIIVGAVSGLLCILFLLVTAMLGLGLLIPLWASALCVAAGVGVLAAVTVTAGMKRLKAVRAAPKTVSSLKENVEWAKQQIK